MIIRGCHSWANLSSYEKSAGLDAPRKITVGLGLSSYCPRVANCVLYPPGLNGLYEREIAWSQGALYIFNVIGSALPTALDGKVKQSVAAAPVCLSVSVHSIF